MAESEYLPVRKPRLTLSRRGSEEYELAAALRRYTTPGLSYDAEFDAEIRRLQPDWFYDSVAENTRLLIQIAKSGAPKPTKKTRLGQALGRYTSNRSSRYCQLEFDDEIRALRPDWFPTKPKTSGEEIKSTLLSMSRRPSSSKNASDELRLASALYNYTNKNSNDYDAEFDAQMRALHPDWLEHRSDRNKRLLFELAQLEQEEKPNCKIALGAALQRYTNENSGVFDPEFNAKIREMRPGWFDRINIYKQQLLKLATDGADRPRELCKNRSERFEGEFSLSRWLNNFIHKGYYFDPEFSAAIKELRPDWFPKSLLPEVRRSELLEMAKNGKDRPHVRSKDPHMRSLAGRLAEDLKTHSDSEFVAEIYNLRPDWFRVACGTIRQTKRKLTKLAKSGAIRPTDKLGAALTRYTCKKSGRNCYDPEFHAEISKLRPDWFDNTIIKKQSLLEIAKNGEAKPTAMHALYYTLRRYTNKSCKTYDADFDAKIRALRPDWFN